MRQGRTWYPQGFLYLADGEPFIAGAHQQAHDFEARGITDLGKDIGGVFKFHERDDSRVAGGSQLYY
jgi:hypothetical protein